MRRVLPRSQFRHDLSPQLAPDVGTGPFGGGHHVVAGIGDLARWAQPPTRARRTRGQLPGSHNPQGVTVLGVVYLFVRAVHAHAQHFEQNASSDTNLVHPGSGRSARSEQETTTGTSKSRARQWKANQACSACRYLTPLMSSRYRPGPRPTRMRALSHEAQRTIVPMPCP